MNVNLYYSNRTDNLFIITLSNSINSFDTFLFNCQETDKSCTDNDNTLTRLVSGYETNYRAIYMNMATIDLASQSTPAKKNLNAYVISCIRLPFFAKNLIFNSNFSTPLTCAVIQYKLETQVWHILGIRKNEELKKNYSINGVSMEIDGYEKFFKKEIICIKGNVPAALIFALNKHLVNELDLEINRMIYPSLEIKSEIVTIIKK